MSDTEIDVTAPDASDEAPEGDSSLLTAVSADFTGPGGDDVDSVPATLGDNYYVFGAPVVDSIAPASGPLGGGNTIKIMGSGFEDPEVDLQGILFDPVGDTDGSEAFDANSGDVHVVWDNEIDVIVGTAPTPRMVPPISTLRLPLPSQTPTAMRWTACRAPTGTTSTPTTKQPRSSEVGISGTAWTPPSSSPGAESEQTGDGFPLCRRG